MTFGARALRTREQAPGDSDTEQDRAIPGSYVSQNSHGQVHDGDTQQYRTVPGSYMSAVNLDPV